MSEKIPAWALKKLLEREPEFKKIPPLLYDMWKSPESESEYEEFVSNAKELWENYGSDTEKKKPADTSTSSVSKEDINNVMKLMGW